MLIDAVQSYLALRRACGFKLRYQEHRLRHFAQFSMARGKTYVCSQTATEWAALARSVEQRTRRLRDVIQFARHVRAENPLHELPRAAFGRSCGRRPTPYIYSPEEIERLIRSAREHGGSDLHKDTYGTLFALIACTGLRVSEALQLRLSDLKLDGLVIRSSKFRKTRLVPLHDSAWTALKRFIERRRGCAQADDPVFVSSAGSPLPLWEVEHVFHVTATNAGLPRGSSRPRATLHGLRHTFAVRALESCPEGRDRITQHMVALSTYLGHAKLASTYWYLEATPLLMRDIAERFESFATGARS
jgi:integrase/recombinase XerD